MSHPAESTLTGHLINIFQAIEIPVDFTKLARLVVTDGLASSCTVEVFGENGELQRLAEAGSASTGEAQRQTILPLIARGTEIGRLISDAEPQCAHALARLIALALDHQALERKLDDSRKLRDEFLTDAAHRLRTPLTSLCLVPNLFQKLLSSGPLPKDVPTLQRLVQTTSEQIHRLNDTVNELVKQALARANAQDAKTFHGAQGADTNQ